ncbi:MAG TPA: hypothetical protein VGC08_07030 [Pedobacter sp.]
MAVEIKQGDGGEVTFTVGTDIAEAKKTADELNKKASELSTQLAALLKASGNNLDAKSGFADLLENFSTLTSEVILQKLNEIKTKYEAELKAGTGTADQQAAAKKAVAAATDQAKKLGDNNGFNNIQVAIQALKDAKANKVTGGDGKISPEDSKNIQVAQNAMYTAISQGAAAAAAGVAGLGTVFDQLGVGGEKLQVVLKDVAGVISGAGEIAKGLATDDPVAMVTGSIKLLTSAIDLFNGKDRQLERQINGYKAQLTALGLSYKQLQRDVSSAVGNDYYTDSQSEITNLQQQQATLTQMRDAENDKKKTDQSKIDGYNAQLADIPGKIDDINKAVAQTLIQTNFRTMSDNLANAFSAAFKSGEDSAKAFDDVFDDVVSNAIKNSLKFSLLDQPVKKFTDDLAAYAKDHNNSVIGFDFATYKDELLKAGQAFDAGLQGSGFFDDQAQADAPVTNGITDNLSGRIESITTDQADQLSGLFNGFRTSQMETNLILTNNGVTAMNLLDIATAHFNTAVEISANTLRSANNTDRLANIEKALVSMDSKIGNTTNILQGTGRG